VKTAWQLLVAVWQPPSDPSRDFGIPKKIRELDRQIDDSVVLLVICYVFLRGCLEAEIRGSLTNFRGPKIGCGERI
jgi:hypothetical protein